MKLPAGLWIKRALLLATALVLLSCGGGGDSSPTGFGPASTSVPGSAAAPAQDVESRQALTFVSPQFTTELVATLPPFSVVGMAWAPDGRLFVWQKNGVVRVIKQGVLLPTPFIDLSAKVNTFDDRGFWGLAFHPNFASNGFVYMSYVFENGGNPNSQTARTSRLTRVKASAGNPDVADAASEMTILGSVNTTPCSAGADCIPAEGGSHSIGALHFAPDGKLFFGNGDGSDGDSLSLRAQNLGSYSGKILRVNDDGTAPSDNPFYDGTNSIRSKVWLYGVRNPFGFDFHPQTGHVYFGDVGWNTFEEVNHGQRGSNHGWPCYEGLEVQGVFASSPTCQQLVPSTLTPPVHVYDRSQGSAVIGGSFYTATLYPPEFRGSFFFADYTGNWIRRVVVDENGAAQSIHPFASDVPAPVAIRLGPDGMLYYMSFTSGQLVRIRYNGVQAAAAATPLYGYSPLMVSFSSAGSIDANGASLTYLWDFGDGTTSSQANPAHTYNSGTVRVFNPKLTVSNAQGASATASLSVTVGSIPPTPTITLPSAGTSALPGQTVAYQGSATDPDDGPLPPSALSWTVLLHHNTHVHTFVGGTGTQGSFVAEDHGPIGSFSYEIILTATDSSGLKGSTSVFVSIAPDGTAPSAPTGLSATAAGQGQVNLGWTAATDNVGVTGYQVERCQGAGCTNFTQVATPAGTSFGDIGLAPSTSYSYRVRAVDASGNLGGYSSVASAITSSTPPSSGLVAAYGFNEGTGGTVADASGNGNTGTITGASWSAAGRYGSALVFNGVDNLVRVASSASLNLGSAMTLQAWIQPSVAQSGWRTIMQRQVDAWFLNASNQNGPLLPAGGGTFGSATVYVSGSSASPVGAWTHVALTYDASMLRLYVNGVLATSQARTGAIQSSSNPLWIGGNLPYGEYFQGLIDEVRVYNRALSPAEIQADMSTPIAPATPDTTAPGAPGGLGAVAADASRIDLSWTAATDNVAVTGYRVERCQGAGCTAFAQVASPTDTGFSDTGLAPGTSYSYRVRATDAASNLGGYSNVATTSTQAPDTTAPTAPASLVATASGGQVSLSWTAATDDVGVTGYRVERCQGAGCTNFTQIASPPTNSFSNTGLSGNTTYSYRVRATDAAGNLGPYSSSASATTPAAADTTAPTAPTGLAASVLGTSQINLAWTASTDNVDVTGYRIERCQGGGCTNFVEVGTSTTTAFSVGGLATNTQYRFRVRANDAAGNNSGYSNIVVARTQAGDTTRPSAPTGLTAVAASSVQVNLNWTASTDNVGVTGYRVERCQGAGCTAFAEIASPLTASHADTGRTPATVYRYRVRATDAAGNLSTYSGIATVTTPSVPDTTAPSAPAGLSATAGGPGQIGLAWTAATDNVGVTGYQVERCQGVECTNFTQVATPAGTSFGDIGLAPSTSYSYRVRAVDASGNLGGYSNVASATTSSTPPSSGLVAAYGFTEGTGDTVADASGNGNTGTITGASWSAAGRYGSALVFNGVDNLVRVASSASLNLGSAMTLQAWIQPSVAQSGWRTIMQRQVDAWFLNASNQNGPLLPAGGGTFGSATVYVSGSSASPVGAWTHVALTYDASMLRLYVNGVLATSQARTGAIQSSSNPLWIGGNLPYGEYFQGLIDEVRVYNRALSPAEIQADMNTPVAP